MGYSFYIINKEAPIHQQDFDTAMANLSEFNRTGGVIGPPCDVEFRGSYIRISGSFSSSGKYADGFVLNLLMRLLDLGYIPRVLSRDWGYGTEQDWQWLQAIE